jgi:hypothetical protein
VILMKKPLKDQFISTYWKIIVKAQLFQQKRRLNRCFWRSLTARVFKKCYLLQKSKNYHCSKCIFKLLDKNLNIIISVLEYRKDHKTEFNLN